MNFECTYSFWPWKIINVFKSNKYLFFIEQSLDGSGKNKNSDFSYWAWSTLWGYVLSLKSFCQNPVLSWAIRYSVFQPIKSTNSFENMSGNPVWVFDIWWSSLDMINDLRPFPEYVVFFPFGEINISLSWVFSKKIFL